MFCRGDGAEPYALPGLEPAAFSSWQPSQEPTNSWLGSWTLSESLGRNREFEGVQSCSGGSKLLP